MRDRSSVALAPRRAVWPPDDTEESVLGTDLHQTTITNLRLGLNEAAALATTPGEDVPWRAGGQTIYQGFRRPDGSAYQTLPDVFVRRGPLDLLRPSRSLAADGPPLLIIEVLSPTTHAQDLHMTLGKGYSYARAGVQEYLILDPMAEYLPEQGQGWRLVDNEYRPWPKDRDGRWRSRAIGVAFGYEGIHVAIYTADSERMLREGESAPERLRLQRLLAQQEAMRLEELARHGAELAAVEALRLEELERHAAELAAMETRRREDNARHAAELAAKDAELAALRRRLQEP